MKEVLIPILAASISIVLSACSEKPAESTVQPAENEQGNTEVTPAAEKTEKSMFDLVQVTILLLEPTNRTTMNQTVLSRFPGKY